MKPLFFCLFPVFLSAAFAIAGQASNQTPSAVKVDDLRCEYRADPLGIDATPPRLQWILKSTQRGARQTAYQILVASSPALLAQGKGDLWDSGKVVSEQSSQIDYKGRALSSGEFCYWKARVWDGNGYPSAWSAPARWSMGLLHPSDWKAQWIGYDTAYASPEQADEDAHHLNLSGLSWLTPPTGTDTADHTMHLRQRFTVPEGRKISRAVFVLSCDNEGTATINGVVVGQAFRWERTARLEATAAIHPGENTAALTIHNTDFLPPAAVGKLVIVFDSGDDLVVPVDQTGKVSGAAPPGWDGANFDDSAWPTPTLGKTPWGSPSLADTLRPPVPYLRRTFTVAKPIKRAMIYVTALGVYDLHLNGKRVSRDCLNPGWTDFRKRVNYQTYDVTHLLHPGANAIGAMLGDGWYAGCLAFTGKRNWYGGKPRLLAQLVMEHTDGSVETAITDSHWKARFGPIQQADLLLGGVYDGREQLDGWDLPDYRDEAWSPVVTSTDPKLATLRVQAEQAEPARVVETLPALKVTEPKPGCYTFDLGQNMVGWTRLTVSGTPGQKITVRHGEMLNPDGTVYTANLRAASGTDIYYLRGNGPETLEPPFTLKGFRYVEVRGLTAKPPPEAVCGVVVSSDMRRAGNFACSDPLVNQLYHNIIWSQKGNYVEVPTDCPQRDERAGWTGDTEFFMRTGAYNYDVASFFTRWLVTMCEDSQHADGSFAHVAPDLGMKGAATAWGDAALQCTYHMYQVYGDTRVIADHYAAMSRYMDFLAAHSASDIADVGGFGDWLNLGGGASRPVIDTAYYAYLAGIMAEMAQAIGKTDDAKRYAARHQEVRAAFIKAFLQPDGSLQDSSQTGYALLFTMGLTPPALKDKAAAHFAGEIARFQNHLATGFIGTPRLLPGLHAAGRDDLAYTLLQQDTYPSWLSQVKMGATTMWERWDGWTPDRGFQTVGMNSFNHYAFGAVGEYLYSTVAGIDTDGPGYQKILICPVPGGGLTYARASYQSIHGLIASAWTRARGRFALTMTIPANTSATVYVPTDDAASVTESGKPAARTVGVQFLRAERGAAVFHVGSGTYKFRSALANRTRP